ncbi:MAG: response regulator [Acidobacteriota bacterium]|nr:response regulator [Acidobacteriota bacterium]
MSYELRGASLESQVYILIVEDNPGDIRLMREALRDCQPPVSIQVAMDAEQALECLQRTGQYANAQRPTLIFLDFNLPKTSSRELLKILKDDHDLRLIPVAVLTTSDAEADVRDAYDLHANCYLRKPVDLDGFFATIRTAANFWLNVAYTANAKRSTRWE